MKIYVVTQGEYSDYHIVCVTDNIENAEMCRKVVSDQWDEANIETFDTDDVRFDLGDNTPFQVAIWDDGSVDIEKLPIDDGFGYQSAIEHVVFRSHRKNDTGYRVSVLAKDRPHALKKAADFIMQCKYQEKIEGDGNEHTD